jgi:hypothetical protein
MRKHSSGHADKNVDSQHGGQKIFTGYASNPFGVRGGPFGPSMQRGPQILDPVNTPLN